MKRDLDLIRKLLLFYEAKLGPEDETAPPVQGYDDETIRYHLILLHDAGYLRCEPVNSKKGDRVIYVLPFELTWAGHEYLDTIRDPLIWNQILAEIKARGLESASVEIIKKLADTAIRKRLNLE